MAQKVTGIEWVSAYEAGQLLDCDYWEIKRRVETGEMKGQDSPYGLMVLLVGDDVAEWDNDESEPSEHPDLHSSAPPLPVSAQADTRPKARVLGAPRGGSSAPRRRDERGTSVPAQRSAAARPTWTYDDVPSTDRAVEALARCSPVMRLRIQESFTRLAAAMQALDPGVEGGPGLASLRLASNPSEIGRTVTISQAADYLGLSRRGVRHALDTGKINGWKEAGIWRLMLDDVERYRGMREYWAEAGGRWTPYGRLEKKGWEPPYKPVSPPTEAPQSEIEHQADFAFPDREITLDEAAAMVQVSLNRARQLADERDLGRVYRTFRGQVRSMLSLHAVLRLLSEREGAAYRKCMSPKVWHEGPTLKPFIRSLLQAAPGDELVDVPAAAAMLGVGRPRVRDLLRQGRLFGFQKQPGRQGSMLFLSRRQLERYASDPARVAQRKRREARAEPQDDEEDEEDGPLMKPMRTRLLKTRTMKTKLAPKRHLPPIVPTDRELWLERYGLQDAHPRERTKSMERDRGEFFTVRQAAEAMGIRPGSVRRLIQRGRLAGSQRRRFPSEGYGNKWWFVRKDDVYRLLADGTYRRHARHAHGIPG